MILTSLKDQVSNQLESIAILCLRHLRVKQRAQSQLSRMSHRLNVSLCKWSSSAKPQSTCTLASRWKVNRPRCRKFWSRHSTTHRAPRINLILSTRSSHTERGARKGKIWRGMSQRAKAKARKFQKRQVTIATYRARHRSPACVNPWMKIAFHCKPR